MTRGFILSLLLHLLIFSMFMMVFFKGKNQIGNERIMQVQLTNGNFLVLHAKNKIEHAVLTQEKRSVKNRHFFFKGIYRQQKQTIFKNSLGENREKIFGERNKLLFWLHDAIQQQLNSMNLIDKEKQQLSITFRLWPDGHMDNLIIRNDSDWELHEAVRFAINQIQPVKGANCLKSPEDFEVTIKLGK